MLPTSTDVDVTLKSTAPPASDAVAFLVHKQTKADEVPPDAPGAAIVKQLIKSKLVAGKSNEVTIQLLDDILGRKRNVTHSKSAIY